MSDLTINSAVASGFLWSKWAKLVAAFDYVLSLVEVVRDISSHDMPSAKSLRTMGVDQGTAKRLHQQRALALRTSRQG